MSLKYSRASESLLVPRPYVNVRKAMHAEPSITDLVVLGFPAFDVGTLLNPLLVLGNGEEVDLLLRVALLPHSHNGSHELD
jgi:hypothetical protein